MKPLIKDDVFVPLTVPAQKRDEYVQNYLTVTGNSGNMLLFSGDQKIEHLNEDFYGEGIDAADNDPAHLFTIAQQCKIGAFAAQLGLIARYASEAPDVSYIVKLNSKTNLVPTSQADPVSRFLYHPKQIIDTARHSGFNLAGFGYTVYLGSEHEALMLEQAAQAIYHAHTSGLLAILWMYPRGKAVRNEHEVSLVAGAAGVAAALGADFVKINPPQAANIQESAKLLRIVVQAAGRTNVLCSGGSKKDPRAFLTELYEQLSIGNTSGAAIGRNIHQKSHADAATFCKAAWSLIVDGSSLDEAYALLDGA